MSDIAALITKVPQSWQRQVVPFIQRSAEFEQVKQPTVSYFLLQYVAHVGMKLHKTHSNKAESTPFIMALLDLLEAKKMQHADAIAGVDGRTELSRAALMLFSRADDAERGGAVSEAIVKLFYSSSLLFEATQQFMDDEKMDPFAAEKHKYAQVVAAKMKKALAGGPAYVSPSGAKEKCDGDGEEGAESTYAASTTTASTAGGGNTNKDLVNPTANIGGGGGYSYNPPPPPTPPPQPAAPAPAAPPAAAAAIKGYSYTPAPAPHVPSPAPTPAPAQGGYSYSPPQQQQQPSYPSPSVTTAAAVSSVNAYVPPSAPAGAYNPSANDMIDAQKYAKLAVSALQFYDHQNARKQLVLALQILDGQKI